MDYLFIHYISSSIFIAFFLLGISIRDIMEIGNFFKKLRIEAKRVAPTRFLQAKNV